eukprot:gene11125-18745_t
MGAYSPEKLFDPTVKQLRGKKCERLQVMRQQERALAYEKAHNYRQQMAASKQTMRERMAEEWEQEREIELRHVSEQLNQQLEGIGTGHANAAEFVTQRQTQLAAQQQRTLALEAAAQQRYANALSHERERREAPKLKMQQHVSLRSDIFPQERAKARLMTEQHLYIMSTSY